MKFYTSKSWYEDDSDYNWGPALLLVSDGKVYGFFQGYDPEAKARIVLDYITRHGVSNFAPEPSSKLPDDAVELEIS